MTNRWRIIMLIAIMAVLVIGVTVITFFALYDAALDQQRSRLVELARSQATLIEAMARFDAEQIDSDDPSQILESVLSQLRDSHANFEGLGGSGEFTLARLEDDQIVFLLKHRHQDSLTPPPVPFDSDLAEPMRRALSGESGTVIGLDYRGEMVLAAYEPVPSLGLGVVAKIDRTEVREPFIRAGLWVIGSALLLIMIGMGLFWKLELPLLKQLDWSEKGYRTLFDQAADAIIASDMNLVITDWNRAAEKLYGWQKEEVLGQVVGQVTQVEHINAHREAVLADFYANGFWTGEVIQHHRNGTPIHINSHVAVVHDSDGQPSSIVAINRDITARKQMEKALRDNEEKYHSLVDDVLNSSASGIYIVNEALEIVWVNEAIEVFFGFPRDQLLGQLKPVVIHERIKHVVEDPNGFEKRLLAIFEDNVGVARFECHVLSAEGRAERWLEHVSRPILTGLYAGGRIEHYYDITERKQVEQALRETRNQLALLVAERTTQLQTTTRELQNEMTERQQLEATLQRYSQDFKTLHNVFDITFSKQSLDEAFVAITLEIKETTGFPIVALELYDKKREVMVFKALQLPDDVTFEPVTEVPLDETLSGGVVRTMQRLVEKNAMSRPEYADATLRQLEIETYICVPMIVNGEVIGTLSLGHRDSVMINDYFVDWLANLANYIASLVTRKQTFENELVALEKLAQLPSTPTTSQALGVKSLHEQSELHYNRFADEFEELMELALEQRLYKVDHKLSERLQVLAQQLGFLKAGPRDMIELYSTALKTISQRVSASKVQIYTEEGRLLVLELMGYLVSYYRRFVSSMPLNGDDFQGDRD